MILDGTHRFGGESLPAAVDWCAAGACNAILDENQHGCYGACWAFSAVAAIESAHFIASGRLLKLSEQQMMDCAGKAFGNAGCDGGQMRGAFNYAAKSGKPLCLERGYEYFGPLGPCRASSCGVGLDSNSVLGYRAVAGDEQSLMSAVAQQPVSVAVRGAWGDLNAFQNYTGGVLSAKCEEGGPPPAGPDHGVLLVGYGVTTGGEKYWKIRNSYGVAWGEAGYALLERGKRSSGGECGIRTNGTATYPVLKQQTANTAAAKLANVILILSDDQDARSTGYNASGIAYMPHVNALLREPGALFLNHVLATPLCAPSRAVILTGRMPHNTKVFLNDPMHGADAFWMANGENRTVAVGMRAAGYQTMLVGKYMNGYGHRPTEVPPGWDEWHGFTAVNYYAPAVSENGVETQYNDSVYSTDLIRDVAVEYIERHANDAKPFFLYLAPKAPHAPFTPAKRHANLWPNGLNVPRVASFNEPSDATQRNHCSWISDLPLLDAKSVALEDTHFANRVRTLQAVDELVRDVVGELSNQGVLETTYIIYMGDNGFHMGHHRMLSGKQTIFEEDIRVPMLLRGPRIAPNTLVTTLTGNYDVTPTILDIANFTGGLLFESMKAPDGLSLLPLVEQHGAVGGATGAAWTRTFTLQEGFYGCYPDVKHGGCESQRRDAPAQCTVVQNTNYKAKNIDDSAVAAASADACCGLCAARQNGTKPCRYWSFNAKDARSKCWLKWAKGDVKASVRTTSGELSNAPPAPTPAKPLAWSYRGLRVLDATRGRNWAYAEWCDGETELYNITADPWQLHNVFAGAPALLKQELAATLHAVAACKGASCPGGDTEPAFDPNYVRQPFKCEWPSP